MWPELCYVIIVPIISIISLIGIIVISCIHFVKKTKFKIFDYILMLLFFIGVYLFMPWYLVVSGSNQQNISDWNISKLEKAAKLSIIPFEKSLCYDFIATTYIKRGNGEKAIEYYEKSINGNYKKHSATAMLALLYAYKGDYDKIMMLSEIVPERKNLPRIAYIQRGEYQKALDTFDAEDSKYPGPNFVKAALYRELGNTKEADRLYSLAEQQMSQDSKHNYWNVKSFKTIQEYKEYYEAGKKRLNFK